MPKEFSFIKRFFSYFLLLLIPVLIVGYLYFNNRVQRFGISIQKEQEKEVELKVSQLSDYFRFIESEILTITQQDHVTEIFSGDPMESMHARSYMESYFAGMIRNSGFFDQVRIVCSTGVEHVKVNNLNGNPQIVGPDGYRKIADRYYFEKVASLAEGKIYISRFDLDPEKTSISYPVKPILRIATPIIRAGELYGVFIANIKGHEFFENLRIIGNEYGWETYFLNQKGNFLMGPDPLKEWQTFKDSVNAPVFQDQFSELEIINSDREQNTLRTKYGLFTYYRIDENNFAISDKGNKVMEENWFVVSFLPTKVIAQIQRQLFDFADAVMLISGLLLVIVLSLLFTNNVRKRYEFEQQLINSERDLKLANKTKDKFISILAHDLKNPIASITGFTELIKTNFDGMSQAGRDKVLGAMENATKILIRLIDDVLTWARSQSGSIEVDPEIIFMNKVIDDAVKISALQAAKKDISIKVNCPEEVFAMADQHMIDTVLRNLINNAIKFSHRGSEINIGIKPFRDETKLVMYVQDKGIGIPAKDKKTMFSLDSVKTTPGTEKEAGTGMGLILCKDFIERNGGELWFDSSEGKGSTFYFSLPAYLEDIDE